MRQEAGTCTMVGTDGARADLRRVEQGGRERRASGRCGRAMGFALGVALLGTLAGCHKTPAQSTTTVAPVDQDAGDPADANMAPVSGSQPAQVLAQNEQYQPQQQGQDYAPGQQAAPIVRQAPGTDDHSYDNQQAEDAYAADLTDAEASQPPPPLPEYEQPPAPDPDYLWTPGYWGWADGGYYWVPGSWVAAPYEGALWTPGYWGFYGGNYRFHHGFWGLHIGFYGGVDYGYGYTGYGYYGGYWNGGHFYYNTSVNRVNVNAIHNTYQHTVVVDHRTSDGGPVNRVSFNGGRGGIQVRPRASEIAVLGEQRHAPMASQVQVQHQAAANRGQFYSQNKGRPAETANARPVVADHTPPAALPRVALAAGRVQPGQAQGGQQRPQLNQRPQQNNLQQQNGRAPEQGRPEVRQGAQPGQAVPQHNEVRPAQTPQPEQRGLQPQPEQRGLQPEARPNQPQSDARPQDRQEQVQPRPEARPTQPEVQARPPQQARAPEQVRPQQARPQHLDAPRQPTPQVHAAPASHPQPQPQPKGHEDDKDHR
jgi:hypothetical protein